MSDDERATKKRRTTNHFTPEQQIARVQFILRRQAATPKELLSQYSRSFRYATYTVAMDSLHKALAYVQESGCQEQQKWATNTRNALKDKKNVRAFREIFARPADESQEELANAVASGAARALKNAISPVVEHTSRKVRERFRSSSSYSSSWSSTEAESSNTADIARQLFVAPPIVNPSDNTTGNPDGKEDETCSDDIPDVFKITCDLELPNDAVVREVDLTQDMRRCLQEIKQEGDLKVALHSDEILFLNNILVLHNDQEPGPIVKRSGLYTTLMKLGKEHDTEKYQLPGQDQLDLLAVARKVAQLPATIRPADVIFPAYKPEAADYNRGLEILYAFASHVQTAPSSSREADFTVHYVVSMLSALQGPGQNFTYDTLSAHVKTRRPDVALNIDGKEIFICEITSQKRASNKKKVSLDFIRLGRFMKAAVNNGVSKPVGVIVAGLIVRFYVMELAGPGIYIMQQYGTLHLPAQTSQLGQLILDLPLLLETKARLDEAREKMDQPPKATFLLWIRSNMDSPTLKQFL